MWAYGNDDHSAVADAMPLRESVYLARRMVVPPASMPRRGARRWRSGLLR